MKYEDIQSTVFALSLNQYSLKGHNFLMTLNDHQRKENGIDGRP